MKVRLSHPNVFVTDDPIVKVKPSLIDHLEVETAKSDRKRVRFCAHKSDSDPVHEMIIALARETYIPPHRHREKSESFHVVKGTADVVVFDDEGGITDVIPMGPPDSGRVFFYRIALPLYHTVVIHSDVFVIHETTNGPLRPELSGFAPWAPPESDAEAGRRFMAELRKRAETCLRGEPDPGKP